MSRTTPRKANIGNESRINDNTLMTLFPFLLILVCMKKNERILLMINFTSLFYHLRIEY